MSARIYIACLAAYNGGALHGQWIDATDDVDEMTEQVDEILATSPRAWDQVDVSPALRAQHQGNGNAAAITRHAARLAHAAGGPGAPEPCTEEWAIHDHEGLPGIGEFSSLVEVAKIVEFFEEHDEAVARAVLDYVGDLDCARTYLESYSGSADTREAWAMDRFHDEIESKAGTETADRVLGYFDAERYLRDFDCGGGLEIEADGQVHFFG